ncbi:class I SAM-dependent methyltransferase [Desulfitobacterium hafniense]|nr:class I SAM-dependent methyltransferase [Desulfitobacterium hafniense]
MSRKERSIDDFFRTRFSVENNYVAVRYRENNRIDYDIRLIKRYINHHSMVLDLGCGTGIIEERLAGDVYNILGVDKYKQFLNKAYRHPNVVYKTGDVVTYCDEALYDLILSFGVIQYMDTDQINSMLQNCSKMLLDSGHIIIKAQFGIKEAFTVDKYSEELGSHYYACYHQIDDIVSACKKLSYSVEVIDIYPEYLNRWENTHDYAVILRKVK